MSLSSPAQVLDVQKKLAEMFGEQKHSLSHPTLPWPPPSQAPCCVDEYQYEKIQYDVIRVVVLLPGFEADPIRCQVRTVPRKRSTPYTAVSYTWATEKGDATKSQCIYIHSEENLNTWAFISVTVNCENALRQLRDVLTHNVVWVDSVCVNQKDVAEVNDQVSAMVETYICATNTAICLNTPGKDFVEAIKLFISEPDIAKQTERSGQLDLACRPALVQLAHLFELRYFQRVWVVQEVVLADKVLLYIDGAVVPFEKRTLRYMNALCSRAQISIPLLSHWSSVYTGVTKDGGLDMVSILKMSMQCSASDPRDRVFATTGFLRSSVRAVIPVDYSLSLEHVLAYAASACIRCRGDLEILRYAKLPLNASVVAASSFGIEQFEDFIARTKPREGHGHVYAMMQSLALVPKNQVLPPLQVLARYLDVCIDTTAQSIYDLLESLESEGDDWNWFLDVVRNRYESTVPGTAISASLSSELKHAIDAAVSSRPTAFRAQSSVGFTGGHCVPGDFIFDIFGAPFPFLLRAVGPGTYRIVGECYLWADVDTRYWHPSQLNSGLAYKQPDLATCRPWTRQVIEVY